MDQGKTRNFGLRRGAVECDSDVVRSFGEVQFFFYVSVYKRVKHCFEKYDARVSTEDAIILNFQLKLENEI